MANTNCELLFGVFRANKLFVWNKKKGKETGLLHAKAASRFHTLPLPVLQEVEKHDYYRPEMLNFAKAFLQFLFFFNRGKL